MIQGLLDLASAFGLSTSAGLNAYIPMLALALLAKFTELITLARTVGCIDELVDYRGFNHPAHY